MSKNKATMANQLNSIRPRVQQTSHTNMFLRTFNNNLPSLHKLVADGTDHINIDYKASTQLGSLLAETSPVNLVHPVYGPFATLIGFWHWLRDENRNDQYRHLRSREVFELTRNGGGVKNNHVPNMVYDIAVANHYRVIGNKKVCEWVEQSELPFDMYYYYQNGRNTIPIRKDYANWFVAAMEETRYAIQNNTEPNFQDFLDNPDVGVPEYNIAKNYTGPAFTAKKPEPKQRKVLTDEERDARALAKINKPVLSDEELDAIAAQKVGLDESAGASTKPKQGRGQTKVLQHIDESAVQSTDETEKVIKHKRSPEEHAIWKANKQARRAEREAKRMEEINKSDVHPTVRTTSLIPVYIEELNKECFTDASIIEPVDCVKYGVAFKTSPLNPSKKLDLLGISTHEELLNKGEICNTDLIDPNITISNLYFLVTKDTQKCVLRFVTEDQFSACYVAKQSGNYRKLELDYKAALLVDENTVVYSGGEITELLRSINSESFIINVSSIKGSVNIETGLTEITHVDIHYNENIGDVQFVGYDLKCDRVNFNANKIAEDAGSETGQLVDVVTVVLNDAVLQDNGTIVIEKPFEEPIVTTGEGNAIEEGPTATAYIPQVTSNTMEPAQSLDTAVQQESTQATNEVSTTTAQ